MHMLRKTKLTASTMAALALLTAVAVSSFSTPAFAIKGDHARFNTCKQLEAQGNVRWHGIATGTEDDAFSISDFHRNFHVRACFANQQSCKTWVKRIWWEIPTMDELHNAWCRRL